MIQNVARELLVSMKVVGIAAVGIVLSAQTEPKRLQKADDAAISTAKVLPDWALALTERLRSCFYAPERFRAGPPLHVRVYLELRRDGTLAVAPRQVPGSSHGVDPSLVQSAIRAVEKCQPYSFLPRAHYVGGWDRLDVTFSTHMPGDTARNSTSNAGSTLPSGETPKWLQIMQPERKR